jgi:ATP-dependent Zn protease
MSVILWGPPGSGKTTIAHLVAGAGGRRFVAMSALNAGVKDVRAVIDAARRQRRAGGEPTVLFIDEVRDRGLARARRAPQDHRHRAGAGHQLAQRRTRRQQVALADQLVQRGRPHPHGERRVRRRRGEAGRG